VQLKPKKNDGVVTNPVTKVQTTFIRSLENSSNYDHYLVAQARVLHKKVALFPSLMREVVEN